MVTSSVAGMPRIGPRRELKAATEGYWAGKLAALELGRTAAELRADQWLSLHDAGIGLVPSNTFSLYDHVLDTAVLVDAVPPRFRSLTNDGAGPGRDPDLDRYFALARGGRSAAGAAAPLKLTKWFGTNYHHLVAEVGPDTVFRLAGSKPVDEFREAAALGVATVPTIVGPVTFLRLAEPVAGAPAGFDPMTLLDSLVDVYGELLARLAAEGAQWVRFDEPCLATDLDPRAREGLARAYARLGEVANRPRLQVCAAYGPVADLLEVVLDLPVEGLGFDLCRGRADLPALTAAGSRLSGRTVLAGVVDGRNVWVNDLAGSLDLLERLAEAAGEVVVSTSCSLLHVPLDAAGETDLDPQLRSWLAFARQKVGEVVTLARGLADGRGAVGDELAGNAAVLDDRAHSTRTRDEVLRSRLAAWPPLSAVRRTGDPPARRAAQAARLGLPLLPTTTIGSFPQTPELRRARAAARRGELPAEAYEAAIRDEIARVVRLQEDAGLDVLVHGEPERDDMVSYFAERLDGMTVTTRGWVQSYGTRYVRPPIVYGDVRRPRPITAEWTTYAQSLTARPVKGMLTGPVTLLHWSFPRDDQPLADTCLQLALAVHDEVRDLQDAGVAVVQVDEPALPEGLPLRRADRPAYLEWATGCFRSAVAALRPGTQLHTHMCYGAVDDVAAALADLDVDVVSVESARSGMSAVGALAASRYAGALGPGVWDVHSPYVPDAAEMARRLRTALEHLPAERLWANPDCGLKTRGYAETVPGIAALVAAAQEIRTSLAPQRA